MFAADSRYAGADLHSHAAGRHAVVAAVGSRARAAAAAARLPPAPGQRPARPARGPLPQRPDRLLAALRRQQRHVAGALERARADRHPGERPEQAMSSHRPARAWTARRCPTAFYDAIEQLEVEENADRPGRAAAAAAGQPHLRRRPRSSSATAPSSRTQRSRSSSPRRGQGDPVHLRRLRALLAAAPRPQPSTASTIDVWAQDASWLMNIDDTVKEWSGQTDGEVANAIFGSYGFTAAAATPTTTRRRMTPTRTRLFQRATDLQFLRGLARRNGKLCRVACTDTPGVRTGYFVGPDGRRPAGGHDLPRRPRRLDRRVARLRLGRDAPDRGRRQPGRPRPQSSDDRHRGDHRRQRPGPLDRPRPPDLRRALVDPAADAPADVAELPQRTAAVLREAGWFVRCTGEPTPTASARCCASATS